MEKSSASFLLGLVLVLVSALSFASAKVHYHDFVVSTCANLLLPSRLVWQVYNILRIIVIFL